MQLYCLLRQPCAGRIGGMTTESDEVQRARLLLSGELVPPVARPAATVALVRDGVTGLEVYLLRRVRAMAFAAGMHVFPGGSVDPADHDLADHDPADHGPADHSAAHHDAGDHDAGDHAGGDRVGGGWVGPSPAWWAGRFGTDEALARALVGAAVRETFEEAGVLLAGPSADRLVDDVSADDWEDERVALEAGRQSLPELLARRGLRLRADLLAPVAHWITPEIERKRFDTYFFVAALPERQVCREAGTEADRRLWISPQQALSSGLKIMPPTEAVLQDLATHRDVASALRSDREIHLVMPRFEIEAGRLTLIVHPAR
jgi:8-oxo-dGTP pyrophosphatase MutT (NUDIX family)